MFSWLAQEAALSNIVLTARAQTVDPNDSGRLVWPTFFPRVNVDSIRLADISTLDFRPVSDRREWNQRGRQITLKTPDLRNVEMIPIESYFKIGEYEIQRLMEQVRGNEALFRQIVGADIPARVPGLAEANFRRLEVDAMTAWALGTVTVRDPQGNATSETISLQFASDRYFTAPTIWNDAGVNAYDLFLQHYEIAEQKIGPIAGIVTRLSIVKELQKDAPRLDTATNIQLTRRQLVDRIEQDTGRPFSLMIHEESLDVYDDGGAAVTRTKVWPAQRLAFVPEGFRVGSAMFAPVARAYDLQRGGAAVSGLDIRGNSVFSEVAGNGRELTTECQLNAMALPDEQKIYVVNTLIP